MTPQFLTQLPEKPPFFWPRPQIKAPRPENTPFFWPRPQIKDSRPGNTPFFWPPEPKPQAESDKDEVTMRKKPRENVRKAARECAKVNEGGPAGSPSFVYVIVFWVRSAAGCRATVTANSILHAAHCLLLAACCLLLTACRTLLTAYCCSPFIWSKIAWIFSWHPPHPVPALVT